MTGSWVVSHLTTTRTNPDPNRPPVTTVAFDDPTDAAAEEQRLRLLGAREVITWWQTHMEDK